MWILVAGVYFYALETLPTQAGEYNVIVIMLFSCSETKISNSPPITQKLHMVFIAVLMLEFHLICKFVGNLEKFSWLFKLYKPYNKIMSKVDFVNPLRKVVMSKFFP